MNQEQFLQDHPEFAKTSANLVAKTLARAARKMGGPDFSVWPSWANPGQPLTLTDDAHGWLTAHMLQTTPFGTEMRLDPKATDGSSVYWEQYWELALSVAGGMLVAGAPVGPGVTSNGQGSLYLSPGAGTVALVNGSLNITFSLMQAFQAGTVFAFVGAQPGALYALASNMSGTAGTLTAQYTGPTSAASSWNVGAL